MKNLIVFSILLVIYFASCTIPTKSDREKELITSGWKFSLSSDSTSVQPDFNDTQWRTLDLPHDWSVEGEFSDKNPAMVGGGALPGGIGWYRKKIQIPATDSAKIITIAFDGVYMNSEVYVNGIFAGKRPNGYISFNYDITKLVKFGSDNTIAVKVDNSMQPNSRWYSGSGIYRNVWLIKTNKLYIPEWGTYITTPKVDSGLALVSVETTIANKSESAKNGQLIVYLIDSLNKQVAKAETDFKISANGNKTIKLTAEIKNPALWDTKNPALYTAICEVKSNKKIVDTYQTVFGIRTFEFNSSKGFIINGQPLKILGVCNHHDLGALGTAINTRALERQLEIMRKMGVNAIRTSHNPPAPELLDLCDKMGFLVMDEAFDMWAKTKTKYDYSLYWNDWHTRDLTDLILRDRNHPAIFMWSIGNEILEQWDSTGTPIASELASIVKSLDSTRFITSACNDPKPSNFIIKSGALDVIGYNYQHNTFADFPNTFPGQKFIATETTSSLHTRGFYQMPSDTIRRWPRKWDEPFTNGNPDNTCSAYDNCSAPWGSTHEETWKIIKKYDFLSGLFIWTGFDYLGEPTPYVWPSRSSYFGIVDLAGFPKDAYYMYQSEWTNTPVLHIFPHWNWTDGQAIDIWAYTNFNKVELFVNGVSQGVKSKQNDQLHLQWNVKYKAGSIKAIGTNPDGSTKVMEIKTAGDPAKILIEPDRSTITANGTDLSFVTVTITDKDGNVVPFADNLINFEISGNGTIAGVDNGNQTSHEPFKANYRKAFNGKCLIIIKSDIVAGSIKLKAAAKGLQTAETDISTVLPKK